MFSSCHERGTTKKFWVPWQDEKHLSLFLYRAENLSSFLFFTKMLKYLIVPRWSLSLSILSVNKPLYTNDSLTTAYSGLPQDLRLTQAMAYVRYTARYIHQIWVLIPIPGPDIQLQYLFIFVQSFKSYLLQRKSPFEEDHFYGSRDTALDSSRRKSRRSRRRLEEEFGKSDRESISQRKKSLRYSSGFFSGVTVEQDSQKVEKPHASLWEKLAYFFNSEERCITPRTPGDKILDCDAISRGCDV